MSDVIHPFIAWEERIICPIRGTRVVHFYLKDVSGEAVLAVVGTERSIRHMMYIVPDDFLGAYGSKVIVNGCTKWRARREVVEWLNFLVEQHNQTSERSNSQMDNNSIQDLGSLKIAVTGSSFCQNHLPERMAPRKLKVQNSDIVWSGLAWICTKQLEHYPAFCRNSITIAVHSFVLIMAEEERHYLGYLEDLYEDKKGQKKVKVRWFHLNQEVEGVISQLNPHPREVFITPHVQVISAECIDGPAAVLTPKDYEKCLAIVPHMLSSGVYMCYRQLKNNKVKPFTLTKLRGYSNQAILIQLNDDVVPKQKEKCHKEDEQEGEEFSQEDSVRYNVKKIRRCKEHHNIETSGVRDSTPPGNQITKCGPTFPKLVFKLPRRPVDMNAVELTKPQFPLRLKVNERLELFCQDSGIRGCWFSCKVVKTSQKNVKVKYEDLQSADETGKLEEWVPQSRVAAPDRIGIRCPGRLTIRPRPPVDLKSPSFMVGTPVDAWWSDGWWEGVVTGIHISGNDAFQVYFPGENVFRTVQKTDARISRDWIDNTWVDLKAKPDILSYMSANRSPSMKLPTCSTMGKASGCGGPAQLDHKVPSTSKLEVVKEVDDNPELTQTGVNEVKTGKGLSSVLKNEGKKCGGREDDNNAVKESVLVKND